MLQTLLYILAAGSVVKKVIPNYISYVHKTHVNQYQMFLNTKTLTNILANDRLLQL